MISIQASASETRAKCHGQLFDYDTTKFNFKERLEELFGCSLAGLHEWLGSFECFDRRNDQHTLAHRVFYSNYARVIKPVYDDFMSIYMSKIVRFPFSYQVIPTFRIGLPGNRFVGEYHKDSKYAHPEFELNFNLALSNYLSPCCLMSEKVPDSGEFYPIECRHGQVFSFNHIDCMHGSEINTSSETMVSFDFRLAMIPFYKDNNSRSINMKRAFSIGDYFSSEIINSNRRSG